MTLVALVDCAQHDGLRLAVERHPRFDLAVGSTAGEPVACDFALAVDHGPAPDVAEVRRYLTAGTGCRPDVVACRHQLSSDGSDAVVAPFPVEPPPIRGEDGLGVFVRGPGADEASEALEGAGHVVHSEIVADTAVVLDSSPEYSDVAAVRRAMAAERVVIGLGSNHTLVDTIRPATDGLIVDDMRAALTEVDRLLRNPLELARLGFEARAATAEASWARVLRALTTRPLTRLPRLDSLGARAAAGAWRRRLGHAVPWSDAELSDELVLGRREAPLGPEFDLAKVSPLRLWALRRGLRGFDVEIAAGSGTLRHDVPGTPTPHSSES